MIDEDMAALHAPFVLIKELAFRVKKFGALFVRGRGSRSGRERRCRMRDVHVIVGVGDVTGGGFFGIATQWVPILFSNSLVFFPFSTKTLVTVLYFVQPFTEIHDLVQLFSGYFLRQPNLHTRSELLMQLVIRQFRGGAM